MESSKSLEEELLAEVICPVCGEHHDHDECCGHDHDDHDHHHDHEHHHHHGHARPRTITIMSMAATITIITIMSTATTTTAVTTITTITIIMTTKVIIMRMRCSQAGDVRRSTPTQRIRLHRYPKERLEREHDSYGNVLRAKGMVAGADGEWIYFDMVPGEHEVRAGAPEYTGRIG